MGQSGSNKIFLRNTVAWALLAGVAAAGSAQAQTAAPADQSTQSQSSDQSEAETVVVTGSRLRNTEFNSPDPIQVITTETGRLSGTGDVAELIQSSTLAQGSPQNTAAISSAFVTEGGPGSQTVSLRGLGANRTLVLVNGRRGGPAGTRGQVSSFDLNVLPLSVIDRIEIDKTGASSVYGSDAVAGVVNIITKKNLDGGSLDIYGTQPWDPGGEEYRGQAVWGHTWSNAHITASFDYYKQNELTVGQRNGTRCETDYVFNTATGARDDRIDPRTGRPSCNDILSGQVWLYEYSYSGAWDDGQPLNSPGGAVKLQYDPGGVLAALLPQSRIPAQVDPTNPTTTPGFVALGFDRVTQGALNANPPQLLHSSLIPQIERYTAYTEGSIDIGPNVEAYAEVLLNRRISKTHGVRQFWTYLFTYDYFYPGGGAGWGDSVNAGWNGSAVLSPTPITDHFGAQQQVDYSRFVGGLRGSFAGPLSDFDWDFFFQKSRSDGQYTQDVILDDAVRSAQLRNDLGINIGNSIDRPTASCVGYVTPISHRDCVDVNWLSPDFLNGTPTAEEAAFLFDRETGHTIYDQLYVQGTVAGDVMKLPAGNAAAVLGFEIRGDRINDVPGPVTLAGNSWGLSSAGITKGRDQTDEVFGELGLPIVKELPFAEDVSLTLSSRYTNVRSYGSDSTYKVGINWQIDHDFRIRATKGTSFRAPALFEQFLADQTSFIGQRSIDPCIQWGTNFTSGNISQRVADNCAADGVPSNYSGSGSSATVVTGGGKLDAETSQAWTAGIVWTPGFADFNVAIDYFEIEVDNEVTQLGAGNIVFGCYNSTHHDTEPLCNLFFRGQTASPYLINTVTDRYINVATQNNRGIDVTTRYTHQFPFGDFTAQGQFTWQLEDNIALVEGITQENNGRVGDPKFVGNLTFDLEHGPFEFFWGMDMIGPASDKDFAIDINSTGTRNYVINTEATVYHNVSVTYRADKWMLTAGIRNLSDETPPNLTNPSYSGGSSIQGNASFQSQYDFYGRTTFLELHRDF